MAPIGERGTGVRTYRRDDNRVRHRRVSIGIVWSVVCGMAFLLAAAAFDDNTSIGAGRARHAQKRFESTDFPNSMNVCGGDTVSRSLTHVNCPCSTN